ncbi:MAG: SH3 domain-containing protein [Sarcina sp.]
MKKSKILALVVIASAITMGVGTLTHTAKVNNTVLLTQVNSSKKNNNDNSTNNDNKKLSVTNNNNNSTTTNNNNNNNNNENSSNSNSGNSNSTNQNTKNSPEQNNKSSVNQTNTQNTKTTTENNQNSQNNQNLTKAQVQNLKNKTVNAHGMKFSGLTTMKIAPNMPNAFATIPGFNPNGFASNVNEQLYNYELNPANDQAAMNEAINLHDGNPVNTCVFFQSSALRAIGESVPDYIGYTTHLENWLANNGWTRHTNFATIQRGDLVFASYYHTFLFMGWENKAKGIAYVMGNESFNEPYFRNRNLNGQSPINYGNNNSYYQATCYWTYGQGYTGQSNSPNPVQANGYNAIGTALTTANVNLRASDGTWSSILGQVPNGTTLAVMQQSGNWFEVYYDGQTGWVDANYTDGLDESMGSGATSTMPVGDNLTVTSPIGLWLTTTPTGSNIVCLPDATPVKAIGWDNGYYKVNYEGTIGWLDAEYTSANGSDILPASDNVSSNVVPQPNNNNNNNSQPATTNNNSNSSFTEKSVNGTVTVNCDGLWLNSNPFPNDGNQIVVPQGTNLTATAESNNGWFKVTYNGITGWVGGSPYSSFTAATPAPAPTKTTNNNSNSSSVNGTVTVNCTAIWINSSPEANVGNLITVPHGTELTTTAKSANGWYQVSYNGVTGWIGGAPYTSFTSSSKQGSATNSQNQPTATTTSSTTGTIDANGGLWLNGNPNLSNPNGIEVIPNGATVQIEQVNGAWDLVDYDGTTGWSYNEYINTNSSNSQQGQTATVTDGPGLWLNGNPSLLNPNGIEVMPQGATMEVLGQQGNWTEVNYNGTTGWAYTEFLNIN